MLAFQLAQVDDLDVLMKYMEEFHNFDHTEPFDFVPARAAMEKIVTYPEVGRVWLIQAGKETVGYIVLTFSYRLEYRGRYAFLDELYVRESKRGRGIGTAALTFIQATCKQLGINKLQLEVKQNNPAALALYQRNGFQKQDRQLLLWTI
ncbi:MAG: GNAT family N-acetyltransferase [Phormidesmis sp.]